MIEKCQSLTEADSVLCNSGSNDRKYRPFFQTSVQVAAASPAWNQGGKSMYVYNQLLTIITAKQYNKLIITTINN